MIYDILAYRNDGGIHELYHPLNTWDKNKLSKDTHEYSAANGDKYYSAIHNKWMNTSEW